MIKRYTFCIHLSIKHNTSNLHEDARCHIFIDAKNPKSALAKFDENPTLILTSEFEEFSMYLKSNWRIEIFSRMIVKPYNCRPYK